MSNDLITLDQAKAQLRLDDSYSDMELEGMITAASAIVVGYLKTDTAAAWTIDTVPSYVQTAVLMVLSTLYQDREGVTDPIGVAVKSILWRDRDPALA